MPQSVLSQAMVSPVPARLLPGWVRIVASGLIVFLSGCASLPTDPAERAEVLKLNDPLEPANREVFAFNTAVWTAFAPITKAYNDAGIAPVRSVLSNFLGNLREPLVFANDLAQGKECAAGATLRRFMVNSTLGVGGVFDVAKRNGIEAHDNDIGLTLGVWGVPEGPYLMLPVLGPSSARDATGQAAEYFADPTDLVLENQGWHTAVYVRTGLDAFDQQAASLPDLIKLQRTSLDGYAALRSAYRQNVTEQINDDFCPEVLKTP
jgi:phospholipid-binding lipoprotein MlaA